MELQGRVTVITGGASGIGAACARAFSLEGAKVVIADVNVEGARAVADDIGAIAIACDVGKEEDVGSLVEMTEKELGTCLLYTSPSPRD